MYKKFFKPLIDVVLSFLGLVILSPLLLISAIIVKLDSPGPVLFKQRRVGLHKTYFNMLKFRTMKTDTPHDAPTHLLKNTDHCLTRSGKIFRKYSLA